MALQSVSDARSGGRASPPQGQGAKAQDRTRVPVLKGRRIASVEINKKFGIVPPVPSKSSIKGQKSFSLGR